MNYQLELDNLINSFTNEGRMPRLCLHSCCAPCSSYVLSYLMEFFDISVFYYNPNIYPEAEYAKRLSEQRRLIEALNAADSVNYELNDRLISKMRKKEIRLISLPYDHGEFLRAASGLEKEKEGGLRCNACFELRLSKTFQYAKENGYDFFGTTLSVSPHKNAVLLNSIGSSFAGPPQFLISDFKKREGYKISILLSKQFDLYRQNYCGCEFSIC